MQIRHRCERDFTANRHVEMSKQYQFGVGLRIIMQIVDFAFEELEQANYYDRMYRALFTFGRFIARVRRFSGWFMAVCGVAHRIDQINCRFFPHSSRRTNGLSKESLGSLRRVIEIGIFFVCKSSIRASIQAEVEQAMTGGGGELSERQ